MSLDAPVTADARFHVGEDKKLRFSIYTDSTKTGVQDVTGFALSWKLATAPGQAALVTKTVGSGIAISGVFNADPDLNTQVIEVTIDDVDTQPDSGTALAAATYFHELKRTDAGLEAVLAYGKLRLIPTVHLI